MKKITTIVYLKEEFSEMNSPYVKYLDSLIVDLYPILENTVIPEEALDPKIYDIPEGYYAVMTKSSDNKETEE